MRRIKSHNLAQLLMQLRFTPEKKRRKQLGAAEKLFAIIDKEKEYPFEFVCFRITGFHPKSPDRSELIKGDELLEDLRVFISKLSGRLARPIAEQSERIYTTEQLAEDMSVSTKTIYRWRKQGLIARKYVFDDGIKRFGFLQSKIDEFLDANPNLINQAKSFTRLTEEQKQQIVNQAARLTARTNISRRQIIDRISAKTGKCHETIRYTLLNYDKANPDKVIFRKSSGVIEPADAAEMYRLYKQGCDIKELTRRFNRNKSSIYRIINQRRARAILARRIEFVASDEFLQEDAEAKLLAKSAVSAESSVRTNVEPAKLAAGSISEYLRTLKETPVLNREREVEMFRRYNYLKFLACRLRTGMKPTAVSGTRLRRIEHYMAQAEEIQRRIIEANLRLVVGIARKHNVSGTSLLDLVSEGNISLMRAVEKFDYSRGFRFATFASWIIAKDFARKVPARSGRLDKTTTASLANIHRDLKTEDAVDFSAMEQAHRSLTQVIEDNLTEREQYIILNRFGLVGSPIRKETKTLQEIGAELGLSKERVRQIELLALQKLRQSLSIEEFELLTS
ncbi:MAG: sigma-70 family RNA polymerase sigma factor [Planctomycetota bacterium]